MKKLTPPDPRCTFAVAAYLSVSAVFTRSPWIVAVLLILAFFTAVYVEVSLPRVFISLKRLWQLIIIVAVLQSVFSPSGDIWIQAGRVALLTSGGVTGGLVVLGRLAVLILGGSLFTVYSARKLIQGMIQMRLPYEVAYMVSIGVRFVPLMGEELQDSLTALALRGIEIKKLKMRRRLKVYTYLLLPMIAGSLSRARELTMSMEMRGFGAYSRRTSFYTLKLQRRDYVLLTITALLAILTAFIMITGSCAIK